MGLGVTCAEGVEQRCRAGQSSGRPSLQVLALPHSPSVDNVMHLVLRGGHQ